MKGPSILERRPTLSYFFLVFLIAWGAVIVVVGPSEIVSGARPDSLQLLPVFAAMLLGPALVGLVLMAITDGREGLEAFWTRQLRWRVDLHWYAVALLTTPILLLAILGTLSLTSSTFIPSVFASEDVVQLVAFALISGLFAGFLEEIGWTGFVLPRLRREYSLLVAGLLLGLIWGVWHGLADYWGTHIEFGDLWFLRIMLWTAALAGYRILIAWVYENTASVLLAQLMHGSFTGSQSLLVPTLSPTNHFVWYTLFTMSLWGLVVVVISYNDPPRPQPR